MIACDCFVSPRPLLELQHGSARHESRATDEVDQWVKDTGRPVDGLVEDAFAGYFEELAGARRTLDSCPCNSAEAGGDHSACGFAD